MEMGVVLKPEFFLLQHIPVNLYLRFVRAQQFGKYGIVAL
jgi:hypothetical protein